MKKVAHLLSLLSVSCSPIFWKMKKQRSGCKSQIPHAPDTFLPLAHLKLQRRRRRTNEWNEPWSTAGGEPSCFCHIHRNLFSLGCFSVVPRDCRRVCAVWIYSTRETEASISKHQQVNDPSTGRQWHLYGQSIQESKSVGGVPLNSMIACFKASHLLKLQLLYWNNELKKRWATLTFILEHCWKPRNQRWWHDSRGRSLIERRPPVAPPLHPS